jgi:ABC-2 type transport system permease protein
MRNIWTIAVRELKAYFASPVAYVVAILLLGVIGGIFAYVMYSSAGSFGQGAAPGVQVITSPLIFVMVFTCPALTMRLLSEEQRLGTLELLLTTPVRDWEVVVGKWLGSFLFIVIIIAVSLIYPVILNQLVEPGIDQGEFLSSYLAILLISAAFLGIGVAVSSLFSNQVATFLVTFLILVIFWWLVGLFSRIAGVQTSQIYRYVDFSRLYYEVFSQGVIELGGIIYFLSVTALTLFLGTISMEIRRWR